MLVGLIIAAFILGLIVGFLFVKVSSKSQQVKLKALEEQLPQIEALLQDKESQLQQSQQQNLVLTTDHKHYQEQERRLSQELSMTKQKFEFQAIGML